MSTIIDLSGKWEFCLDEEKQGLFKHFEKKDRFDDEFELPGTVALRKKKEPGHDRPDGYLYDPYVMEGYIWFKRTVDLSSVFGKKSSKEEYKRFVLHLERTRISYVWVDGEFAGRFDSLVKPHEYDITRLIKQEKAEIVIMVSNTEYKTPGGHLTSVDTQTNWNGILGDISIRVYDTVRIKSVAARSRLKDNSAVLTYTFENYSPESIKVDLSVTYSAIRLKEEYSTTDSDMSEIAKLAAECPEVSTKDYMLEKLTEHLNSRGAFSVHAMPVEAGTSELEIEIPIDNNPLRWSDERPFVYEIRAEIVAIDHDVNRITTRKVVSPFGDDAKDSLKMFFGLRRFSAKGMHFYINDQKTFLRGKHDGMIFPLTGFAPMNVYGWLKVMKAAKDMGINHYRFHTCCPPEAAFLAADLLGIYMQPELPFWGTFCGEGDEGYDEAAQQFLRKEGFYMLEEFSTHPSYCMMSLGNELWGNAKAMNRLLKEYKEYRKNILYTQGSNNFQWTPNIQPYDDFFSGVRFTIDRQIRGSYAACDKPYGHVQTAVPGTVFNYDNAIRGAQADTSKKESEDGFVEIQYGTGIKKVKLSEVKDELVPKIPVISHEVGQYVTYPDFRETEKYTGVLQPENLKIFKERLEEKGLSDRAEDYFKNSGALAVACYKDEIETLLRTESLAGFQLLDIQDFMGQGTALVGVLDSFMENKGLISAKDWRRFCSNIVIQAEFETYILKNGGRFNFKVSLSAYSQKQLPSAELKYVFKNKATGAVLAEDVTIGLDELKRDGRSIISEAAIELPQSDVIHVYELEITLYTTPVMDEFGGSDCKILAENSYTLYSYPTMADGEEELRNIKYCTDVSEAKEKAKAGENVLLFPGDEENSKSIQGTYATDFWCFHMFRQISEGMGKEIPVGTLGLNIDKDHPAFREFPTESYTTPQWFSIVENSRCIILDGTDIKPIAGMIDNFERNHNLGLLYELKGERTKGKILVCTSDLPKLVKEGHVEALALIKSLSAYVKMM